MYKILYSKKALKDIELLKRSHLDKNAQRLISIIKVNPFQNPPSYEKLGGNLSGKYSRRINVQHRIVYEVIHESLTDKGVTYEGKIRILRMWSHYDM